MFDFVGAFKRGVRAAKDLNKYQLEIDEVFFELSHKFLEATHGDFTIERNDSFISSASAALDMLSGTPPRSQNQSSGAIFMRSMKDSSKKIRLANWVQQPKGFTFVLQFEQREIISKSKTELGAALEEFLSSPIVGKAYLSLMQMLKVDVQSKSGSVVRELKAVKVLRVREHGYSDKPAAKTASGGMSVAKPAAAAKPAAVKPAAKSAAAKPAAKPAAAKPAAKTVAAKPAAKSAAAKPAAKTVAVKPAAKSAAAKPAAKTVAVKPAAKSAAAKPVAKTVAAKPAAKSAAAKPVAKTVAAKPAAKPVAAKPAAKPAAAKPAAKPAAPRPSVPNTPKAEVFNEAGEVKPGVAQNPPAPAAQ
ncbi:chemotaxis protein histidine kinase CheA [Pseudomonas sp. F-14 TE3623]